MKKKIYFSALATAIFLILALAGAEIVLRSSESLYRRFYYHVYEPGMFASFDGMPYTLAPDVNDVHVRRGEFSTTVKTNSLGLREDREISIQKPDGVYRIIVLGDSFAFGFGVDRDKSFEAVLEHDLNKDEKLQGKKVEVINMGFASGYSPDSAYVYLKKIAHKFQPDLVLHVFCYSNDIGNVLEHRPYSDYDDNGLPIKIDFKPVLIDPIAHQRIGRVIWENQRYPRFLSDNKVQAAGGHDIFGFLKEMFDFSSRLKSVIEQLIKIERMKRLNNGEILQNFLLLPKEPHSLFDLFVNKYLEPDQPDDELVTGSWKRGWEITKRIYRGMKEYTDKNNVKFAVLLVPPNFLVDYNPVKDFGANETLKIFYKEDDLKEAYDRNKPGTIFGKFFRSANIPFFDPVLEMRKHQKGQLYFKYDAHWNEAGNEIIGHSLGDWLSGENIL